MKALRTALLTTATAIAVCALPSAAAAEYLVPPGNSAATQYTEVFPTAGGPKDAGRDGKAGRRSPEKVLGTDNARRLEAQGPEGSEAAEVAAATAPVETDEGAAGGAGRGGGGGDATGNGPLGRDAGQTQGGGTGEVDGSSGIGEVIAHATGSSSSGQMGLLLPLVILATLAWALAYLWRERKKPTT